MANSNFRKQTPIFETVSNCQEKASLDFYIANSDFNQTQAAKFQFSTTNSDFQTPIFENKLQFSRKQTWILKIENSDLCQTQIKWPNSFHYDGITKKRWISKINK